MSVIEDSLKNLDIAIAELKSALQAEQKIPVQAVTNQEYLTDEQLIDQTNIRF
jgi:hypothetical protein